MDTGFNYYHGADPGEYDLVLSNSEGGLESLLALGARRAEAVFWGADPEFFAPQPVEKEADVYFYGYGDKFRREWMTAFVGEPSRSFRTLDFALGGQDFLGDAGTARLIGNIPFTASRARSRPPGSTSASLAGRTRASTPRPRAARSSSPRPARRSSRIPTTGSSAGSSPASELIVVERRGRGRRRLPRPPRRSGAGRGDGPPRARARARRAHLPPPRPPRARPARARRQGACRLSPSRPRRDPLRRQPSPLAAVRRSRSCRPTTRSRTSAGSSTS